MLGLVVPPVAGLLVTEHPRKAQSWKAVPPGGAPYAVAMDMGTGRRPRRFARAKKMLAIARVLG